MKTGHLLRIYKNDSGQAVTGKTAFKLDGAVLAVCCQVL